MGDAVDLAEKLLQMIEMSPEERELMGQAGRKKGSNSLMRKLL